MALGEKQHKSTLNHEPVKNTPNLATSRYFWLRPIIQQQRTTEAVQKSFEIIFGRSGSFKQ
jgi:hypothetical protein